MIITVRAASVAWGVFAVIFGWTFFAWSWFDLFATNDPGVVMSSVAALVIVADGLLIATLIWISHNQRLARRGRRGIASAVRVPRFERDGIDRAYVLPDRSDLHAAPVLIVSLTAGQKVYTTSRAPSPALA